MSIVPAGDPGVLALPTDNEWAGVDDGWMGTTKPEIAPVVPLFSFNAKADGGFTDEATGEIFGRDKTVKVVWLAWSENRAWWELEFGKGDKAPSCRSADMLHPDPASPNRQAESCAACPQSKWQADGSPPACGVRINVMLYLLDEQRITRTSFSGLALKHVARFIGSFKAKAGGRPPMAYVTEITVGSEETSNGTFLVPLLRIGEEIPRDEAQPLIDLRDFFMAQWRSQLAEDLASAMQQAGGGPDVGPFDDAGAKAPAGAVETTSRQAAFDDEEPF